MQELHISVRNLVEFIFRAGDIDNRAGKLASAEAMKAAVSTGKFKKAWTPPTRRKYR